ncbi:hypothetical protein EMIT0196MI5_50258 [Pseudomonas sp. IT-196MI5]
MLRAAAGDCLTINLQNPQTSHKGWARQEQIDKEDCCYGQDHHYRWRRGDSRDGLDRVRGMADRAPDCAHRHHLARHLERPDAGA